MPKVPVDECPAGPAMDAAVAKALGYTVKRFNGFSQAFTQDSIYYVGSHQIHQRDNKVQQYQYLVVLPYSTDIAAAMGEVAESCKHRAFFVGWSSEWVVPYCVIGSIKKYGETIAHAISRAFLKAKGIEFIEMPE